jgi:AraC family transcriptional regulator
MHQLPENIKEKDYHQRLRRVLAYIQDNLTENLQLEKLSEIACFSPFHFQKIFTLYIGESPKQYIIRLRLERIAHYLKIFPELSVYDLSFQSGFSSHSTFSRAFRKYYGFTPETFRNLPQDEISKIGTSKPNKSKYSELQSAEFWSPDLIEEEVAGWKQSLAIEIKVLRSLKVAFIDSHLGHQDAISEAFKALTKWAQPRDLIKPETQFIGIMLDMPFFTEYRKCRFRACIAIPEELELPKESAVTTIPGGKYAVYEMKGTIQHVFKSLVAFRHGWLDESGYQISEITGFELYSENPASKPHESILRQIFVPIKPA